MSPPQNPVKVKKGFRELKLAADVLNKWVFRATDTGNHAESGDAVQWRVAGRAIDPLIPSFVDQPTLRQYLQRQLYAVRRELCGGMVTDEQLSEYVDTLTQECRKTAKRILAHAQEQRRSHREDWDDEAVGMVVQYSPDGLEVILGLSSRPQTKVRLWSTHFKQLCESYQGPKSRLISRVFNMVMRYETLSRIKSGHQSALPAGMFTTLQEKLSVTHECFASPLNRHPGNLTHCSLFHDVDRFFGSLGSFFDWIPVGYGVPLSFECNPPYDAMSIKACFGHIRTIMATVVTTPVCFVVVVPDIEEVMQGAMPPDDPLVSFTRTAPKGRHHFLMGMQHRRTGA